MLISINLMSINIIYIMSKKIIIETWKISSIYVDHRTIYIDHTIPLILITILIQQTYHITEDKLNIYKHIQQNLSNTKKMPLSIYFVPRNNSHTRKLTQHIPPTHTHTHKPIYSREKCGRGKTRMAFPSFPFVTASQGVGRRRIQSSSRVLLFLT